MISFKEYTRDYKAEYKKFQSSPERIKYRAELARMVGKDPEEEGYDVKDIENKMEAFMAKVKKDGFPVESGDMQDLEIYTRKVAKKESGQ